MIHYQLNESIFTLGETVAGSCEWLPSGQESGRKAKLTVGWITEGRGDVDRGNLYAVELIPQRLARFSCKIPLSAHPSYDGELLRIIWEVRVEFVSRGLIGGLGIGKFHDAKGFRVVAR